MLKKIGALCLTFDYTTFYTFFLKYLLLSAAGDRILHNDPGQAHGEKSF